MSDIQSPTAVVPPALLFSPTPSQRSSMADFPTSRLPQYLFRVFSPASAGSTSATEILPHCMHKYKTTRQPRDVFATDPSAAAFMVERHLRWRRGHEHTCSLVSWTSSLLFALQYGFYKASKEKVDLSEVNLMVIDTAAFEPRQFIKDLDLLAAFEADDRVSEERRVELEGLWGLRTKKKALNKLFYFGEYISQGRMDVAGRCAVTDFGSMVQYGLFKVYPQLGDKSTWSSWANRVLALRREFFEDSDGPEQTDRLVPSRLIKIAKKCFGGVWALPVAIMFLALKPRARDDSAILSCFGKQFTLAQVEAWNEREITIVAERQPELEEFENLKHVIVNHIVDGGDILNALGNLAI
ncbi:hypothetical protein EJ05DRAFT_476195 [Pseudovirgaria hyperparasitica]|uniref:DUF7587 domain-containing protein n=1 Tax=Pseudovirgaria hyperparasitica TaxID=470096 RepID=A0A6A6W7G5_9PEZI|nr:uncharacterized protein EJ05DRAFT_476195 [Pseudovirgaria hyperparasitica]KAF2757900.1 hypothetical protein EJ05DRAFT_476195 [Pseudovirgaria hyperparasitica]